MKCSISNTPQNLYAPRQIRSLYGVKQGPKQHPVYKLEFKLDLQRSIEDSG